MSGALPLKDLLRGLRSGMTAGRVAIDPLSRELHGPLRGVVDGLDIIASRLEATTSRLAHSIFDEGETLQKGHFWTLQALATHPSGPTVFAQLAYGVLGAAYKRFSDRPVLVSETLAAQTFQTAMAATYQDRTELPAEMLLQLKSARVIRYAPFALPSAPKDRSAILAYTAFVILLCIDRDAESEHTDLLDLCCDTAPLIVRKFGFHPDERSAIRTAIADCARLI
ncbi:hypothetical protein [Frigidibacter sp. ROC022]|uniref:hypothetical protein n=1 Tax=Frigidibacter sp. ROC022 TaxID=2971796 RepID=UPI00215AD9DC|nr:hypothetical protein [Frigidibacter sp. ROC022]MCR8722755.1 hypothetical protein [Frigidibacter sp. ROC022]